MVVMSQFEGGESGRLVRFPSMQQPSLDVSQLLEDADTSRLVASLRAISAKSALLAT